MIHIQKKLHILLFMYTSILPAKYGFYVTPDKTTFHFSFTSGKFTYGYSGATHSQDSIKTDIQNFINEATEKINALPSSQKISVDLIILTHKDKPLTDNFTDEARQNIAKIAAITSRIASTPRIEIIPFSDEKYIEFSIP